MYRLMVEVQGEQHYRFVPHFQKHVTKFWDARQRDMNKQEWCRLNDVTLVADAIIGIAFSEFDGTDVAELMRRADVAMYQAKRNGRGHYEVFDAEWTFSAI